MGNKSSRQRNGRSYDSPRQAYRPPPFAPTPQPQRNNRAHTTKYTNIGDDYKTYEQVQEALSQAGLESSNLIVGIDFTKSNEWSGKVSFNRRSLHDLEHSPIPYEQAITIIGKTLSTFDEDNLIPCFGFGDATTHDQNVFSFYPENRPCDGFEEALTRYREIVPHVNLSGPTSFAPLIETAIQIVDDSDGQYHVLLIIADGQVTRSVDTPDGGFSVQEQRTIDAIVKASDYPLSIVLVGVGDGPWDMMHKFDDYVPARAFDNFQFVNFTEIMSRSVALSKKEVDFALAALMEVPSQYKATLDLHLLGNRKGAPRAAPLLPPIRSSNTRYTRPHAEQSHMSSVGGNVPYARYSRPHAEQNRMSSDTRATPNRNPLNDKCPICETAVRDLVLSCGHQTCHRCGEDLYECPVCGCHVGTKVRLY